jgi:hypothetical protein
VYFAATSRVPVASVTSCFTSHCPVTGCTRNHIPSGPPVGSLDATAFTPRCCASRYVPTSDGPDNSAGFFHAMKSPWLR